MTSTKPIIAFSWLLRSYKRRRFKSEWLAFVFACLLASCSARNNPPRFLIDGQTEIVIRLKEGPDTPVGKNMYIEIRCIIHRFTQPHTLLTYVHFLYNCTLIFYFFLISVFISFILISTISIFELFYVLEYKKLVIQDLHLLSN